MNHSVQLIKNRDRSLSVVREGEGDWGSHGFQWVWRRGSVTIRILGEDYRKLTANEGRGRGRGRGRERGRGRGRGRVGGGGGGGVGEG